MTTLFLIFSILFLVMTLSAYAFEKSLRDHLHGKMTVVFLCNLTICFFVAVLSWFEVAPRSSKRFSTLLLLPHALPLLLPFLPYVYLSKVAKREGAGCIFSGYLIQYFFLAFFSSLNAIALNIYLPFSMFSASYQKVR